MAKRKLPFAVCLALVGVAAPALGNGIEYSNFPYSNSVSVCLCQNGLIVADEFTASFSGTLSSVTMALEGYGAAYGFLATNDPADFPGSIIQFDASNFFVDAMSGPIYVTLPDNYNVQLVAGQQYWFGIQVSGVGIAWMAANNGDANPSDDGIATAFEVDAVPDAPEPSSGMMLAMGLAGILIVARVVAKTAVG
jgi:hypothetical protein